MSVHAPKRASITLRTLQRLKDSQQKIAALTAYDASFAVLLEQANIEVVLVGDSLGNVIQGHSTTVPVTVDDIIYHAKAVSAASTRPLLIADLPFMSYWSVDIALQNAARLMQEGGAQMVKLECAPHQADIVRALSNEGIPVCAHMGLRPQAVNKLGGFRVQGREADQAEQMQQQALALQAAGADLVIIEAVPSALAKTISAQLHIPTIGIGAGPDCDGQILVLYDILGLTPGRVPKFAHNFLQGNDSLAAAVSSYVEAVKSGAFPGPEHSFE